MFTLKLLAIGFTVLLSVAAQRSPRLLNGQNANYQVKFPHHVLLGSCGGSIIDQKWILTTKKCMAQNNGTFEVKFERFYFGVNVFSLVINNDGKSVTKHPFSDIALVKLPVELLFDESLKAIQIYQNAELDSEAIGVVPGFDEKAQNSSELKYGIFQFEPLVNGDCKKKGLIDEYTQICTGSYNGYSVNLLCDNDLGSGLVVGWDENPMLLGIVSKGTCYVEGGNEIFTKVEAFLPWIETVTGVNFSTGDHPAFTVTTR